MARFVGGIKGATLEGLHTAWMMTSLWMGKWTLLPKCFPDYIF